MALKHAQLLDVIDLHATDEDQCGTFSRSLLKTDHLQIMQLVLGAGEQLPEHHVAGEITIQCLTGKVRVVLPSRTCEITTGQLIALPAGKQHAVHAQSNATLLVTLLRNA